MGGQKQFCDGCGREAFVQCYILVEGDFRLLCDECAEKSDEDLPVKKPDRDDLINEAA